MYTAPVAGRYSISAVINYQTTAAITIDIGGADPAFVIRNITTGTDLLTGLFPVFNIDITLLDLRGILGNGTVTITGDVELDAGDEVGLFYVDDGLTIGIDLGGTNTPIIWSIHQITEQ